MIFVVAGDFIQDFFKKRVHTNCALNPPAAGGIDAAGPAGCGPTACLDVPAPRLNYGTICIFGTKSPKQLILIRRILYGCRRLRLVVHAGLLAVQILKRI